MSFWRYLRSRALMVGGVSGRPTSPSKISVRGLSKSFDGKRVLHSLDLDIERGESFALVGRSGEGKSVLLKCISGLLGVDSGEILLDGELMTSSRMDLRSKIGIVFQGGALFDSLNVWQNVAFRLLQTGVPRETARARAMRSLAAVELQASVSTLSPSALSGGMRKRVAIARTIASEPEILFFDEPTSGLDPITTDLINDLILNCTKALGATAITITHDVGSVYKTADRVALLYGGAIVWQGSKREMSSSKNRYIQQFVQGKARGPMTLARVDDLDENLADNPADNPAGNPTDNPADDLPNSDARGAS